MRVWMLLVFAAAPGAVEAASFDCSRAATLVEQAICSNGQLSGLDDVLAIAYEQEISIGDAGAVRQRQREWLRDERNSCRDVACIESAYRKRIAELTGPIAPVSVDCTDERQTPTAHPMCAIQEFGQLGLQIDQLTKELERSLTGANREALVDTEGPFVVERNACQNERPEVEACVERVLKQRHAALNAALSMPDSIRGEVALYHYLNPAFVLKYVESLVGRNVHVFGCMRLDPGPVAAERLTGRVLESCDEPDGPQVPVVFKEMKSADWYDDRTIYTHWKGVMHRESGRIVLRLE